MSFLMPYFAAIIPFILWPLELIFPYPAVLEEAAKAASLFFLYRKVPIYRPLPVGLVFGILFAITESTLYLFNIYMVGDIHTYIIRLLLTIPLHTLTSIIISHTIFKKPWLKIVGILIAIVGHYIFNVAVASLS
ncbi:MAG: PrsW family glutamic-type intramembrane protease [Candidatus Roizmanbacteria bacterium]